MSSTTTEADALSFLGLARRAGRVVPGTEQTRRTLREGSARLVLTAGDASEVQLKKISNLIRHNDVPRRTISSRASLGRAIGGPPVSAVAVTDASFAQQLLDRLPAREADVGDPEQWR